ncbi:MAG: exodeoxyribonuclease V subunit gamma [Candidatus Omnitrophica bacterium]|nr:exodeoxyribonuclease V subunit gamma [Candidatus Omnitrophota bacterium]
MSKTLLIGPAGAGKTYQLLEAFEHALKTSKDPLADDFFFLLPSAEHTERIITVMLQRGIPGFFHRRVTTLSRFVEEVLGLGKEGLASSVTKFLIVREIFEKNSWEIFRQTQQSTGFLHLMLSFISELKESMITPAIFRERMNALKNLEADFAAKYEALAAIYEAYENGLKQRELKDEQDILSLYLKQKKTKRFKQIWLDGFFDFSVLQLAILKDISGSADEITITLTADPRPGREDLFEVLQPTKKVLATIGFKNEIASPQHLGVGARNDKVAVIARRTESDEAISYLEKNLFISPKPKTKPSPGEAVMIFEAVGMEGEVEMIARSVETIHQSGDYRFSNFAILFRQIGDYESVIRSVFGRYQIPVEIHERERLGFSPMLQIITRLLKIFQNDWKRADLMQFLKSSYVLFLGNEKKENSWAHELEHRAMAKGIFRGRENWLSEGGPAMEVLAKLEDTLRAAKTFSEIKKTMVDAVVKVLGIFQMVDSLEEYVRRDGASYKRFEAILDEIGFSLKGEITFDQFADRFFRLVDLDLYSLPEKDKNKVQVYDASLARQKEYRVVFVAGLLEKKFPVQIKEDPVLSDWERRLFNEVRSEELLKERLPRQNIEKYLFYLAITRAREKLVLTYPRLDLEGREALPSWYVSEIRALFDGSLEPKKQTLARPYPELDHVITDRELEMSVMGELWNPDKENTQKEPLLLYLVNELLKKERSRKKLVRAFNEIREELNDARIAETPAFLALELSPTSLEQYAGCPFKYFAGRGLKLFDPEEDESSKTRGTILHQVLEEFFKEWSKQSVNFKNTEALRKKITPYLDEALRENPFINEKKYQSELEYESLLETLERFIGEELERLAGAPLQPRYFELGFGVDGAEYPCLEIELEKGETFKIRGKVDRIDIDHEGKAGLVIDYKTGREFKREYLKTGGALQLPIYLMVLEKMLGIPPAGAEIYSIKGRKNNGFYLRSRAEFFPGLSAKKMILTNGEFQEVMEKSTGFIREFVRDIRAMKISARPRKEDECKYCSYAPVCRIEKWRVPLIAGEIKSEIFGREKNERNKINEQPETSGPVKR